MYPAMEDFAFDWVAGRTCRQDIPDQAARVHPGGCDHQERAVDIPLRDRFGISFRLDYYSVDELSRWSDQPGFWD